MAQSIVDLCISNIAGLSLTQLIMWVLCVLGKSLMKLGVIYFVVFLSIVVMVKNNLPSILSCINGKEQAL